MGRSDWSSMAQDKTRAFFRRMRQALCEPVTETSESKLRRFTTYMSILLVILTIVYQALFVDFAMRLPFSMIPPALAIGTVFTFLMQTSMPEERLGQTAATVLVFLSIENSILFVITLRWGSPTPFFAYLRELTMEDWLVGWVLIAALASWLNGEAARTLRRLSAFFSEMIVSRIRIILTMMLLLFNACLLLTYFYAMVNRIDIAGVFALLLLPGLGSLLLCLKKLGEQHDRH